MIVQFTARSAATFWQMFCQPGAHWEQKDWYRGEDPSAENELARLHQFADFKLGVTEGTGEKAAKKFTDGPHSLRKDLVLRAEKVIEHYRAKCKEGSGGILALQFAELAEGLKGNKPDFNCEYEDDDDAEELAKLKAAAEAEKAKEPEAVASGE